MAHPFTGELDRTSIPNTVAEPLMQRIIELDQMIQSAGHIGAIRQDIRDHLSAAALLLASAWIPEHPELVGELAQHQGQSSPHKMTRQ